MRFVICLLLAALWSNSAFAAMGGATSMSATARAARAGNEAAAGAIANTISSKSCSATCLSHGHSKAACKSGCRHGICYYHRSHPFCIR